MSKPNIEGIYPLTFMQEALLFHSLFSKSTQLGFVQVCYTLEGDLDEKNLIDSWQKVIDRHQVLRTSIHWKDLEKPVQVVHQTRKVPIAKEHWTDIPENEHKLRLEAALKADNLKGYDFTKAPLMRMTLIHAKPGLHYLIWSAHHILLDGWSWSLLFREAFQLYRSKQDGTEFTGQEVRPFSDYIRWLNNRDESRAESFWRQKLAGLTPNGLNGHSWNRKSGETGSLTIFLPESKSDKYRAFVKKNRLTLNSLLQGAWALVLNKMTNSIDVTFGKTVSGRAIDLPGVESMLGLFTNSLPVRLNIELEISVKEWLHYIFKEQIESQPFDQTPLHRIQEWSGMESQERLFESLLIFQNYKVGEFEELWHGKMQVEIKEAGSVSSYPLTLMIMPWREIVLHILHDTEKYPVEYSTKIMEVLQSTLDVLVSQPESLIKDVLNKLPELPLPEIQQLSTPQNSIPGMMGDHPNGWNYIPPRNEPELALTKIWEKLFGRSPIGVTDNFFQIGGRSILAVRLFSLIDQAFGRNLPPVTILQHPTIEALAKLISNEEPVPKWSSLVPLRAKGNKLPVFCIHAGGAHVLFYGGLTKHLGPDQPVYALQPIGLDNLEDCHRTIEEMATHYLKEVRSVQPEGPYAFLSICYGNPINLEMVKQIEKAGQEVRLMVIVDSAPGGIIRVHIPTFRERVNAFAGRFFRNPFSAIYKMVSLRISRVSKSLQKPPEIVDESPQEKNLRLWQEIMTNAYNTYGWSPYSGKVTFIRTSESIVHREKGNHIDIWSDLALGGVDVFVVEGHHRSIFDEPEVKNLAIQLEACLEDLLIPHS